MEELHDSSAPGKQSVLRWPQVVGLEQIFHDMEIEENIEFQDMQEKEQAGNITGDSSDDRNSGNTSQL